MKKLVKGVALFLFFIGILLLLNSCASKNKCTGHKCRTEKKNAFFF